MGKYHPPAIIETFSPLWWQTTLTVFVAIALIVWLPKFIKPLQHKIVSLGYWDHYFNEYHLRKCIQLYEWLLEFTTKPAISFM